MDKKIKVMQIMPEFGLAGAEIMAEHLSYALAEEGVDICVVSLYNYYSPITERLKRKDIPVYFLGKKKGLDLKIYFKLYKLFKKEKPTVIHTHLYAILYAVPAAILANVQAKVHTIHNIADKEIAKLHRKICRWFYRYFKVMPVSISPRVRKTVIEEYGLLETQVPMIFNGIDLKKCIPKTEYAEKNSLITILHIGRFSEQKNHKALIDSFKIVHDKAPNTILKLIGEGELEKLVKGQVAESGLGDAVEFIGRKSEVYPYLHEADIFVLPSRWEGMPITLIEAMATGLPIVATSVGGVPDMIEDAVTGLLVDVKESDIAEAILKFVNDSNFRQKIGSAAKIASEQFSAKEMAKKYLELYMSLG